MPSTDLIHLPLTLKMTTAQDVETSVTIKGLCSPNNHTQPTYEMTPGFKHFATIYCFVNLSA